jgi:hypothetical protein
MFPEQIDNGATNLPQQLREKRWERWGVIELPQKIFYIALE